MKEIPEFVLTETLFVTGWFVAGYFMGLMQVPAVVAAMVYFTVSPLLPYLVSRSGREFEARSRSHILSLYWTFVAS